MVKIGLHLPHESSWRVVLQAAQVAGLDVGDAKSQVNVLKDLKRLVHKKPAIIQTHLVTFPPKPSDLEWYGSAYADSPPKALDEQECMMQNMTLRKSKAEVKSDNPKAHTLHVPPAGHIAQQNVDMNMMMMGMWSMFNQFAGRNPDASGSAEAFAGMGLRPGKRQKALCDVPTAAAADAPAPLALQDGNVIEQNESPSPPAASVKPPAVAPSVKPPEPEPSPSAGSMAKPAEHAVLLELPGVGDGRGDADAKMMKRPASKHTVSASKAKAASKATPKAKPSAKQAAGKAAIKKDKTIVKCSKGWTLEIRHRASGQNDKHYEAPDGSKFRILSQAQAYGFPGEPSS